MAISTLDGYIAAAKQVCPQKKTATRTTVANGWFSLFDIAGEPGAGTLAGTSTTAGVVPTDATAGCPPINTFAGSAGYLTRVEFASTVACRIRIFDLLFKAGAYAFNANTALSAQPSYSGRLPGTDYKGLEIWAETVTAATGNQTWNVTYCVDEATQALTRNGWVTHDRLAAGDEILAYDPDTNRTRWERVREVFVKRNYSGDVLILGGREFGAVTTPDHRWPIESRPRRSYQPRRKVVTSETLPRDGFILRGALHECPETPRYTDAFVRVVAWYFTEGCLHGDGKGLTLSQSITANPKYVDEIRADLRELGARFNAKRPGRKAGNRGLDRRVGLTASEGLKDSGCIAWNVRGTDVDAIIACAPGKKKVPTMDFICALTDAQLEMFVDTAIKADGTPERAMFYQHDSDRMDAFMAACVLAGWAPSLDKSGTALALRKKQGRGRGRTSLGKLSRTRMHYEGLVWCPVTTSGHWVARRHGKAFITGNTDQDGNAGATTGATGIGAAPTLGRCWPLPLASGDTGVQTISNVQGGTGSAGTANILVLRPLWTGRVIAANFGDVHDLLKVGMPQIYDTSALIIMVSADSTSSGIPDVQMQVSNA